MPAGPGSGGFTVPLAGMAKKIVAVEPSPAMRAALSHNLAEAHHVEILPTPIEDSLPHIHGPFDLALAVYSLYNVLPIDRVIQKLVSEADLIVAVMGMGDGQAWYHSLYRHFRGRRPVSPPQVEFFYPVLEEMGIQAQVEIVQTSANYVYPDEVSLIDQWMQRLHANPAQRGELHKMLLPLVEQRGARVGIYGRRCTALVWFGKRPRIQHPPFQVVLRDSLCYNLPLD